MRQGWSNSFQLISLCGIKQIQTRKGLGDKVTINFNNVAE